MTPKDKLKKQLAAIEKSKLKLAADRDKLREQFHELEDILESMDTAIEGIEDGKRMIEDAVDTMSQYL
jgi:hypothetical protein